MKYDVNPFFYSYMNMNSNIGSSTREFLENFVRDFSSSSNIEIENNSLFETTKMLFTTKFRKLFLHNSKRNIANDYKIKEDILKYDYIGLYDMMCSLCTMPVVQHIKLCEMPMYKDIIDTAKPFCPNLLDTMSDEKKEKTILIFLADKIETKFNLMCTEFISNVESIFVEFKHISEFINKGLVFNKKYKNYRMLHDIFNESFFDSFSMILCLSFIVYAKSENLIEILDKPLFNFIDKAFNNLKTKKTLTDLFYFDEIKKSVIDKLEDDELSIFLNSLEYDSLISDCIPSTEKQIMGKKEDLLLTIAHNYYILKTMCSVDKIVLYDKLAPIGVICTIIFLLGSVSLSLLIKKNTSFSSDFEYYWNDIYNGYNTENIKNEQYISFLKEICG